MDRIHHIALSVPDIGRATAWYRGQFDVATLYEDKTWALLEFDNIALALVLPDKNLPHFAVLCDNPEAYGPLTKHRNGTASVYVRDPWGNAIEIMKADE